MTPAKLRRLERRKAERLEAGTNAKFREKMRFEELKRAKRKGEVSG